MDNFAANVIFYFLLILVFGMSMRKRIRYLREKNKYVIYAQDGIHKAYVYFVPHTKEQITEILSHKNAGDRLCYVFDRDSMVIKFAGPEQEFHNVEFSGEDYHLSFEEQGNSCLLYVERMKCFAPGALETRTTRVPLLMNAFWKVKVNASVYQI
ncbi:MAG: hypothetical protein HDR24_05260 [Lachnospiraceae bacterium]|nr:hypothetical protein [Lachnospiraceae bacterium]